MVESMTLTLSSLLQMSSLPEEMLEKVLLELAVLKASPFPSTNNDEEVFRELAAVCEQWKRIVNGGEFHKMFLDRAKTACKCVLDRAKTACKCVLDRAKTACK